MRPTFLELLIPVASQGKTAQVPENQSLQTLPAHAQLFPCSRSLSHGATTALSVDIMIFHAHDPSIAILNVT